MLLVVEAKEVLEVPNPPVIVLLRLGLTHREMRVQNGPKDLFGALCIWVAEEALMGDPEAFRVSPQSLPGPRLLERVGGLHIPQMADNGISQEQMEAGSGSRRRIPG